MKFGGEVNMCALYVPEFFQIFWSGVPCLKMQKTPFFLGILSYFWPLSPYQRQLR